jgi:hypothetical protein
MIRTIVAARGLVAMIVAAVVGTWGVFVHPVDMENPVLGKSDDSSRPGRSCWSRRLWLLAVLMSGAGHAVGADDGLREPFATGTGRWT